MKNTVAAVHSVRNRIDVVDALRGFVLRATYSILVGILLFLVQWSFCKWRLRHHKQGPLNSFGIKRPGLNEQFGKLFYLNQVF